MDSPPRGLSPSPSSPSSADSPLEETGLPTPTTATDGPSQAQIAAALASPSQQTKRRLPASSSSGPAREGREIKTRRRDRDDREEGMRTRIHWEQVRGEGGQGGSTTRPREEMVDTGLVDYVRKSTYS